MAIYEKLNHPRLPVEALGGSFLATRLGRKKTGGIMRIASVLLSLCLFAMCLCFGPATPAAKTHCKKTQGQKHRSNSHNSPRFLSPKTRGQEGATECLNRKSWMIRF